MPAARLAEGWRQPDHAGVSGPGHAPGGGPRAARDQAPALLVSLVQQLFSEHKRDLDDAGVTERDLVGLNQVLAPKDVQIRGECRHSARQGTRTFQHRAGRRTVFWREPVKPGATAAKASAEVA
jgi:hypothetical protein